MKWTVEANNQIGAFPYFARFTARRLIEKNNKDKDKLIVEIEDVLAIKENKEIKKLLDLDYDLNNIEYNQNLRINICGGIRGCKRTYFDDMEVTKLFYRVLEKSQILKTIEENRETRKNSSLKVAISGCPNSCSRPQIQDLAIVGYHNPKLTNKDCIACGSCKDRCVLNLIEVEKEVRVKMEDCIGCGNCIGICPTGTIDSGEMGYRILVGGRLGKDPQLAKTYKQVTTMKDLEKSLENILESFNESLKTGVKFSDLL